MTSPQKYTEWNGPLLDTILEKLERRGMDKCDLDGLRNLVQNGWLRPQRYTDIDGSRRYGFQCVDIAPGRVVVERDD